MKNIVISFLLLVIITACTDKTKCKSFGEIDNKTTIIDLKGFDDKMVLKYSDAYSKIEYVVLENTPKSMIGFIDKLEVTNNNDFIVFDYSNSQIIRFNKNGKYLNNIGTRGNGANEYVSPEIVVYNKFSDQVIVYDGAKKSLLHFSLDGKLRDVTNLNKYIANFDVIDSTAYVIFANHRDILSNDEIAYNYEIINKKGEIEVQFEPYGEEKMNFRPTANRSFYQQEDGLVCIKYCQPTIFKFDRKKNVTAAFYLDFGDRGIPQEWLEAESVHEINDRIFSSQRKLAFCSFFCESAHKYILSIVLSDSRILDMIIDKKSNKILSGNIKENDMYGLMESNFVCCKKEKIYGIISNEYAEHLYTRLCKSTYSKWLEEEYRKQGYTVTDNDKKLLYKCANNNNPIIQICTLK